MLTDTYYPSILAKLAFLDSPDTTNPDSVTSIFKTQNQSWNGP